MPDSEGKHSFLRGFSFGLTSGVITTMGAIVGIYAGTRSMLAVMAGILSIAFADAFSDALGIHISEESQKEIKEENVWRSTISAFVSKLVVALSFAVPIIFLPLAAAIMIDAAWGMLLIAFYSYYLARKRRASSFAVIGEHLGLAIFVILVTYYVGVGIYRVFGHQGG